MRTVRRIQPMITPQKFKLRVAAYARDSNSCLHHSLSTQVSYYSRLIQSHQDWELVGVYYDEGISGKELQTFIKTLKSQESLVTEFDYLLLKKIGRAHV